MCIQSVRAAYTLFFVAAAVWKTESDRVEMPAPHRDVHRTVFPVLAALLLHRPRADVVSYLAFSDVMQLRNCVHYDNVQEYTIQQ